MQAEEGKGVDMRMHQWPKQTGDLLLQCELEVGRISRQGALEACTALSSS